MQMLCPCGNNGYRTEVEQDWRQRSSGTWGGPSKQRKWYYTRNHTTVLNWTVCYYGSRKGESLQVVKEGYLSLFLALLPIYTYLKLLQIVIDRSSSSKMPFTQSPSQALLPGSLTRDSHNIKLALGKYADLPKESFPLKQYHLASSVWPWVSPLHLRASRPSLQDEKIKLDSL